MIEHYPDLIEQPELPGLPLKPKKKRLNSDAQESLDLTIDLLARVRNESITLDQLREIVHEVRVIADNKVIGNSTVVKPDGNGTVDPSPAIEYARYIYRKYFDLHTPFEGLEIPTQPQGYQRLLVMGKAMNHRIYASAAKKIHAVNFPITNMDTHFQQDRFPSKAYAIWIKDSVEADDNYEKSAEDLWKLEVPFMGSLEMLVADFMHVIENGSHMNLETKTICAGAKSKEVAVCVPVISWSASVVNVTSEVSTHTSPKVRGRMVVT